MLNDKLGAWLGGRKDLRRKRSDRAAVRFFALESLDPRIVPAVTARFSAAGVLTVIGDFRNNQITISSNAAGRLRVNNGAVRIVGRPPLVARANLIQVLGQGGNDVITLDESARTLPRANLFGGVGNDTLTGGSGTDQLLGQGGDDTLFGRGGVDSLLGGDGNDVLTGGTGNDQVFGEAGNDQLIWNQGEGSDFNEGGDGNDTVLVNGGNNAENFTINANGTRVRFDRVSPAPFSLDIGTSENLVLNANGGDDNIAAGIGLAPLIQLTLDGGAGNDTILGGDGNDAIFGGDGNDFVDGNRGNDIGILGTGDDVFQWDPGDGNDTIEGEAGTDTMLFNGANVAETVDISANGGRVRFFRNVANVTMDLNDVEAIDFNALGGPDTITVNDVSGTDLATVNLNLAAAAGSPVGDGQADTVIVNGTAGNDSIKVVGDGAGVSVTGLPAVVNITGQDPADDQLTVNGLAGTDTLDASGLAAGAIKLTLDGGDGNDTILGGAGIDTILGGDGNDFVDGNRGNDIGILGTGDDVFQWDPGDGNDTIEGEAGTDTMLFNGANVAETVDISANGGRVRFFRNVANVTMDLNDVEAIDFNALGGPDTITVNDVSGTDLATVNLNLAAAAGSPAGDGQADSVIVNGTNGNDTITVAGNPTSVAVTGLAARVNITGADATGDLLTVNALGGNDVVNGSGLAAGSIGFKVDGGAGDDILTGGAGNDTLLGGPGVDILDGGPGADVETQD